MEAHQHYLQGRFYLNRYSEKSTGDALAEFQRAVELDPSFALAWAGLADTHLWYCKYATVGGLAAFDARLAQAREAATRALALEPNLPEALRARADIQLSFDFDWKGAAETLRKALALAPADPAIVIDAGTLALAKGDAAQGMALYRQAVALDPVNPQALSFFAFNLALTGQFAEAQAEYPRVIELIPTAPWSHAGLGLSFLLQGKFEEAAVEGEKDAADWARLLVVAMARWSQKRILEADAALADLIKSSADGAAYQIAEVYALSRREGPCVRVAGSSASSARLGPGRPPDRSVSRESTWGLALERILAHDGPGQRSIEMSAERTTQTRRHHVHRHGGLQRAVAARR